MAGRGNAEARLPLVERGVQALAAGAVGKDARGKPFEPVGGYLAQAWLGAAILFTWVFPKCARRLTRSLLGLVLGA